ncbi:MAG TPA: efflux RND transporter permease subunit [Gemmatimonadaceae bacterium]|jgi:hydrophobic/amphiphilic exporter-1 (mainly G- bacteria), HAE1 family|nr:efflux RND transporter permease subunit [Gemmatimonadaceae bacterium]
MFISDFAIRRPIVTVVTMIALVVFGLASLARLDTDEFPSIDAPIVFVAIAYPGAAPDVVEREVVSRVEDKISGISGVDKINSSSTDGFAQIIVQFVFSKPVDQATQDIRDAISAIRSQLPIEILEPIIQRFDPNQLPIVSLAVTSSVLTPPQLTQIADQQIAGELRAIGGVAQVNVVGGDSAQLNVNVRPNDLAALGVGIDQVVNALRAQNLAAPVGNVNSPLEQRSIRLEGRFDRPEDFANLVISQRAGELVTLGQVADVEAGAAEPKSSALYNGRAAIGLDIVKSREYSTTAVADRVKARVAALQPTLPPGTRIEIVRDAGTRVRHSVRNVEEALVEGAALTVLVVFLFLNSWRSTVITGLALPVSVLASFVPLAALGFTLNTMSLLGLSLAIGILIDDAIVVRENIVRHVELGADHMHAAHEGTDEIGLAVAATTFSIVSVFVPVGFMPGIAGQWFKPFALTIAAAVLVSLFVSFSLDPMLSAYWPDPQLEAHERRNPVARALDRFNKWFDHQAERYKGLIAWALDHRWTMLALAAGSFVLAIGLQVVIGGFGFVPVSDQGELNIAVETPPGSSLDYTTLKAEELARMIRARPEVQYTYTTVGSSTGSGTVDNASIYVRLVPKAQRSLSQDQIGQILRTQMRSVGGATAYTYASGFGGAQKQLQLQLQGPDQATLNDYAARIERIVAATPGAVDVGLSTRGQKPEFNVRANRGLAGTLGVSMSQLATSLRFAFAGVDAGTWVDPSGISRYVHVRLVPASRQNAADLGRLPVLVTPAAGATGTPAFVPLSQIAEITPSFGPSQIDHYQRERVVTIGANIEGASLGKVSQAVMSNVRNIQLPAGYHISQGGETESQNEVFGNIFIALGVAVMLMYLILVVQFGSFLDPLAILISLPLSLIGVVLALLITRDTLNLMSLIGVILLMGIVAKNAILLIDFAKWAHTGRGLSRRDALIEAGRIRLRPILMTTLALIAGMVPVALGLGEGADFRAPLGRAVIGGVITSTILTLVVIPTVYEILDEWRERLLARFRRRVVAHAPAPVPEPGD